MQEHRKENRLEIRTSHQERRQFEEAAQLSGMKLSEFLRRTALEKSVEIIQKNNCLILSNQDRDAFLNSLQNPPKPNKKLKQAKKYHQQLIM